MSSFLSSSLLGWPVLENLVIGLYGYLSSPKGGSKQPPIQEN